MPNCSLGERFFHIFLKVGSREVIILCKLYVVFLYLYIILTSVKDVMRNQIMLCCSLDQIACPSEN